MRLLFLLVLCAPWSAADVILDSINGLDTSQIYSVFGSAGIALASQDIVGPQFTLTQPTLLTSVGAFVSHCGDIENGVPNCPNRLPFLVEIVGDTSGDPDLTKVYGIYSLPIQPDPLTIAFESVNPYLLLAPGTYYALFAGQLGDEGSLISLADGYQQLAVSLASAGPSPATSYVSEADAAVRIWE